MKIEIEFDEVDKLKKRVEFLEFQNREKDIFIKSLDEDELKNKAAILAVNIARKYFLAVFKKLGFPDTHINSIDFQRPDYYKKWLGVEWHSADDLEVDLSVTISNSFKSIILRMWSKIES